MAAITTNDQMIWRKLGAAKNKQMILSQVEAAFPNMPKKAITASLGMLIKAGLVRTEAGKDGTVFHFQGADDAKKRQANTKEQALLLSMIQAANNRGISAKKLRMDIGTELITAVQLRRALDGLEKSGQITSFKGIQQPTVALYIMAGVTPAEDLAGGIWYDAQKEYDSMFVDAICKFLLAKVRAATFPSQTKRTEEQKKLVPNPIFTVSRTPKLPSPYHLLNAIKKARVVTANLTVKNVMECMRALELDGLVEAIKPIGGVEFPDDESESDEDTKRPSKRRKRADSDEDDDVDEDEKERRDALERDKEKERLKERKRREREKAREKKRAKKQKEKEKKRKKKEKAKLKEKEKKKKRKQEHSDREDDDSNDSDALVDINDIGKKKKKTKRSRRAISSSSSDSDSESDSSSSDSSNSESDSDSDSDDDSDVSSVASEDIDDAFVAAKPKSTAVLVMEEVQSSAFARTDLTSLDDTHIVYRATNRYHIPLGQNQAPCGKCPQFLFCEGDGPVNPDACDYFGQWLTDVVGGWDDEGRKRFKPIEEAPVEEAGDDLFNGVNYGEEENGVEDGDEEKEQ